MTSGAVLVAAPFVDIPAWNPSPDTPPAGTPGLWIMAPTGGMALAFSSLSAGLALHGVNHGAELVEQARSPEALNAELRRLGRDVATPGYILAGITLTTGLIGLATFFYPLWVSSGITALIATPFLHAGGAYQVQARRARGVMDRGPAAQVSVSPFGFVLRW